MAKCAVSDSMVATGFPRGLGFPTAFDIIAAAGGASLRSLCASKLGHLHPCSSTEGSIQDVAAFWSHHA